MRGYGQSDRPDPLEAYDIFQLAGDVVGLVNAFGATTAMIVGHDWGAWIAAYLSLFRPELFSATVLLSVPYVPRRRVNQTEWEQQAYPGKIFYQAVFRSPMAEQILQADVRATLLRGFYSLSGQAAEGESFQPVRDPGPPPNQASPKKPSWLSEEDLDSFTAEFQRIGFTGGLNYYLNMDRNWALTAFLDGAKILQPTLFIAGEKGPVLEFHGHKFETLECNIPNLKQKKLLPGVGHWTQQEAPDAVNEILIEFLNRSRHTTTAVYEAT